MIDSRYLTQLAIIVDLGSISRAAESLNLTQPTLSRTVKIIEDRVGSPVLRRGRFGVTPTVIGARLASEGSAILEQSRRAQDAIDSWKKGLTGELRVGVGAMLGSTIMGRFFAQTIEERWPYSIRVRVNGAKSLIDALNHDQIDLAILPSKLTLHQENLEQTTLFTDHIMVCVSANDPLASRRAPIEPAELSDKVWIELAATSGFQETNRTMLRSIGLGDVVPKLTFDGDIVMATEVVEQTQGCCFLPYRIMKKSFGLVAIELAAELPRRDIAMWTTKAGRDRPEIIHFQDRFRAYLTSIGLS